MSPSAPLSSLKMQLNPLELAEVPREIKGVSSVLVVIGKDQKSDAEQILLIKRSMNLGSHRGQVGFPGGYREPEDKDLLETALRESHEEIGAPTTQFELLGSLDPVQTLNSVWIYPWVATMTLPFSFSLNRAEVDRLIYLPVEKLLNEGFRMMDVAIAGKTLKTPAMTHEGETVWGATARILEQLRERWLKTRALEGPRVSP